MVRPPAPDIAAGTEAARALWASGDCNQIARQTMVIAEDPCRIADPRPNERMLGIACGSGNVALIAARRFCDVAGIDLADNPVARNNGATDGTVAMETEYMLLVATRARGARRWG